MIKLEAPAANAPREGTAAPAVAAHRLHVCHVAATTEGALWVFEQLRDLRDRFGHQVTVILNGDAGTLVDRFRGAGIRVLVSDFEFLGSGYLWALPKKILTLARLFAHERFDVVQTHLFHSMVIGRIAAWLADVPVRLSMVAGPFHLEAYTPRWIDGSTQWMETALIPSCEHSRTLYAGMGVSADRLSVIYYGPDERTFDPALYVADDLRGEYGWAADTPLIGMVAYFYAELGANRWTPPAVWGRSVKDHADLIRAMPAVLREFPNAKLLLVGTGWEARGMQYLARMQAMVVELGLSDSVKFTGYRQNIPATLKALDVAVQASLNENLGGSIEGLLMERPMVASKVGGLVDSVIDGETGVLATPGDAADLARAILTLLRDPDRARELGRQGRRLMLERFTLRKTVEDQDRLYRDLFSKAGDGYRPSRELFRRAIAAPVGAYLVLRYIIFDVNVLPAWDAGWRPWHFSALRRFLLLLVYMSAWLLLPKRRFRAVAPVLRRYANVPENAQFFTPMANFPPPIFPRVRVVFLMSLYRLYAFVGRRKLGWGLRAKLRGLVEAAPELLASLRRNKRG